MFMLNNLEAYLVELLQGHLSYGGENVELAKRFSNAPRLPVVTLDLSGGVSTDYFYHDFSTEHEILIQHCTGHVNINLWCNTEDERQSLSQQIREAFIAEKEYHYKYCTQYNMGNCNTGGQCKVTSTYTDRTVKNRCPDPEEYEYESLRHKHHIVQDTIRLELPFDMDEFDRNPPLLRSIFRCSAEFEIPADEGGIVIEDIVVGDVDID